MANENNRQQAETDPDNTKTKKRFRRIRGVANTVTGYSVYKRNISYIVDRLKFPLARRILRNEIQAQKTIIPLSHIDDKTLRTTKNGHLALLVVMGLVFVWGLIALTRGVAIGLKFDIWMTGWLLSGIPLIVLTSSRIWVSSKMVRAVSSELEARHAGSSKDYQQVRSQPHD